jgi:hypothetical protein
MIGVFLKNKAGMLCFVMPPQTERPAIAGFHYIAGTNNVTIALEDGGHETITADIAPELRGSFASEETILVVHVDDKSRFEREYSAPLTR